MTFMPSTSAWLRSDIRVGEYRSAPPADFGPLSSGYQMYLRPLNCSSHGFTGLRQLRLRRLINTEGLDDGGLWGGGVPAVSHPGWKGPGASGHEQTSHRPTGENRSQEPPGDPTPMRCHRNTPNQRPDALT
jgi:hypothetical protein